MRVFRVPFVGPIMVKSSLRLAPAASSIVAAIKPYGIIFSPLMPVRYRVMQSWTLHDVHNPRSAAAVINASTSSTTLSLMSDVMPRTLCFR